MEVLAFSLGVGVEVIVVEIGEGKFCEIGGDEGRGVERRCYECARMLTFVIGIPSFS